MPSDDILKAAKSFATPEQMQAAATLANVGLDKYTKRPSVWNGRINTLTHDKNVGEAGWNRESYLRNNAGIATVVHEHIHMRSAVQQPHTVYLQSKKMEEGVVHLLTEKICKDNSIPYSRPYRGEVDLLQAVNNFTGMYETDLGFCAGII